jgi:ABC-type transport system involved in cytochrome c biogenesis permease subunit
MIIAAWAGFTLGFIAGALWAARGRDDTPQGATDND